MSVYQVEVKSVSLYPERFKDPCTTDIIRAFLKLKVVNEAKWVADGREEIADTITGTNQYILNRRTRSFYRI